MLFENTPSIHLLNNKYKERKSYKVKYKHINDSKGYLNISFMLCQTGFVIHSTNIYGKHMLCTKGLFGHD